jgi:polyisoprenoid-binding protein YceI
MKNSILMMTAAAMFSAGEAAIANNPDATYSVDTQKSQIVWTARKVTGSHTGTIALNSGSLAYQDGKLSAGEFAIDMNSMTCTDLTDPGTNMKLMGHLKSDDFFSVSQHSSSTFAITHVKTLEDGSAFVVGNLTIKGITRQIEFPAQISADDQHITAKAKVVVDRSKFNIRYGSGSFFDNLGDNMIYDNFEMDITIVSSK